jgi:hypothetical protein
MASPVLENERKSFGANRKQWLALYAGKFILVKGEELIGVFDKPEDALAEGARRFGSDSFLVRQVKEADELVYILALTLGILRADSTRPA